MFGCGDVSTKAGGRIAPGPPPASPARVARAPLRFAKGRFSLPPIWTGVLSRDGPARAGYRIGVVGAVREPPLRLVQTE